MEWILQNGESGLTALQFLQGRLPAAPVGYLRQLLRRGKIRRCGVALAEDTVLHGGESIVLPDSYRLCRLNETGPEPVEILYESREILVVYKPAGLAVHRGIGHEEDNLTARVEKLLRQRGEPFRAAPVHRLDSGTSGPVLFGKGRSSASEIGKLIMSGGMEKTYVALATGRLTGTGDLSSPVPAKGKLKPAAASYEVLETLRGFTLLEVHLLSGRTHQIRRQLADIGHPLAGDRRYGGPSLQGLPHPFLHCNRLALQDPFSDSRIEVQCPMADRLSHLLEKLRDDGRHAGERPDPSSK